MRPGRYADLIPLIAFIVLVGLVFLLDRERGDNVQRSVEATEARMERRAALLGDLLGNEISARMGSLEGAKGTFLAVQDSLSRSTFISSLDSTTTRLQGVTSVAVVYPDESVLRASGTSFGSRITLQDPTLRTTYLRAVTSRRPAATGAIDYGIGRRVFIFDPIPNADSSAVLGVLVAELDPFTIYRVATNTLPADSTGIQHVHSLWGPDSVRFSSNQQVAPDWQQVEKDVRVADSFWYVRLSYQPPDLRAARAERVATWIAGLALAAAVALILLFLRRTITTQKEEIARRQAAEEAARSAAAEARERAKEARDLAAQLEAAQLASQRLSTSLNPDDVVELFLGGVAEILDADIASLYTFEEEGELLVGRKRMVFREIDGITDRLKTEDITQVRAPVALLPALGEAVSTGDPYIVENMDDEGRLLSSRGAAEGGAASVTVPLLIAGHTVGVAQWEVFSGARRFPPAIIAFAQALAAPAAASLRTAELFLSLEDERQRASREALRFGAVLDQMADGVIVVDGRGQLERSNEAAEEMLSDAMDEVTVDEWPARFDLVSPEGRPLGSAEFPLTRAMRGERVRRTTFIVRGEWGAERHLSVSAGPILSAAGNPGGAAMVMRDVTDEHQYAEMLRHTNRELRRQAEVLEQVNHQLREATKAKDQFLAVMSHELRTPINAIMGYSDLLDLGVKGTLNDDQRAMLTRVRETSKHLLGLINEVLDLAKIGAGRMDLVLVELDVASIIERAAQQVQPLAAAKGLTLAVEPPPPSSQRLVLADETRLMQIMVNLLSNAVKFTAHGGISVHYGEVENGQVCVDVTDTGPGIPPDQVELIFEEFYQVEGGLSRSSGGTGLGLAISRRFARLMDGDISVSSTVGRGSRFRVKLPQAEAASAAPAGEARGTIVVLADEQLPLDRLADDLEGSFRIIGTSEPAQFAAVARREKPLMVVVDVRAARNGAWRALSALQAEPATAGVHVLLVAGAVDGSDAALEIGVVRILSKPLVVERVAEMVLGGGLLQGECSVLIADSDADVRRILGEALTVAGCDVLTAANGAEMLEVARRESPDVAVVDLLMPGIDGIATMATMRAEPGLQDVSVVATLSREMADEEMARLTDSVDTLGRAYSAHRKPLGDLIREGVVRRDGGGRPGDDEL